MTIFGQQFSQQCVLTLFIDNLYGIFFKSMHIYCQAQVFFGYTEGKISFDNLTCAVGMARFSVFLFIILLLNSFGRTY